MTPIVSLGSIASAKFGFATHRVPLSDMVSVGDRGGDPQPGDLVAGEVVYLGKHRALEGRSSRRTSLFLGDVVVGAYGNRYATDQYEAYVGGRSDLLHVVSVGGVCGQVKSKNHLLTEEPTVLRRLGYVLGADGRTLNLGAYRIASLPHPAPRPRVVVVVGASMNAGKTTTVANAVRGLTAAGQRVAAAKLTGTACSKDTWLMHDAGAVGIMDFTDCGHPSTYLLGLEELLDIQSRLLGQLGALRPDVVVIEIADGLGQRETRMLLTEPRFRVQVDAVLFAGVDSLSVEAGVRLLRSWGYEVSAISGLVTCSELAIEECRRFVPEVPCLTAGDLALGALADRLGWGARRVEPAPLRRPTPSPTPPSASPLPVGSLALATVAPAAAV